MLKLHLGRVVVARWFVVVAAFAFQGLLAPVAHAQLAVSGSGSPSFSLPIAVPPGIAGMQPQLALSYTQGVDGPLGIGWTMQGVSLITRCSATPATDGGPSLDPGARTGVLYLPSDKLCLDGQRLIPTDANGTPTGPVDEAAGVGSGVREYRTERDSFMRIRAYGSANGADGNGPAFFRVWTKSGQIMEYGNTADSSVEAQDLAVVMMWGVNRISDTVGNYIDFSYEKRSVASGTSPAATPLLGKEWNLSQILYTGHAGSTPNNRIQFNYVDKSTIRSEGYQRGSKTVGVRQLTSIATFANRIGTEVPVRTYLIESVTAPSGRSRLAKVHDCRGADPTKCLPAASFTYSDSDETYQEVSAGGLAGVRMMRHSDSAYGVLIGDFDGDGKTDIIRWSDNPAENMLFFSRPTPSGSPTASDAMNFVQSTTPFITDENLSHHNRCYISIVADFNGDGLADILRYAVNGNAEDNFTNCGTGHSNYIYFSRGDGTFRRELVTDAAGNPLPLLRQLSAQGSIEPAPTPGEIDPPPHTPPWGPGDVFYVGDVDGDGRMDIVITHREPRAQDADTPLYQCLNQCNWVYLGKGDGHFTLVDSPSLLPHFINPRVRQLGISMYTEPYSGGPQDFFFDVDGDGLQDIYPVGSPFYFRSNGRGDFVPTEMTANLCPYTSQIADINGDGKADRICGGDTPAQNALAVSRGDVTFFNPSQFNLTGPGQELGPSLSADPAALPGVGFVAVDVNGDGRTDIIRWKDATSENKLYVSNGDGSFRESPSFNNSMSNVQLRSSSGLYDFIIADFTGRGHVDILRISDDPAQNKMYVQQNQMSPDILLSVTTGLGSTSTLNYMTLAQPGAPYSTSRALGADPIATSTYPKMTVQPPLLVVTSMSADAGAGHPAVTTSFAYRDLATDWTGRGLLGFGEVSQSAPGPNGEFLTTVADFRQDFPFIGSSTMTRQRRGSLLDVGAELSRTTTSYCDVMPTMPPNCISGRVRQPFAYQTTTSGFDLSGVALPTTVTTNNYDGFGDATSVVVQTTGSVGGISQTFTKTTTSQFAANNTAGDNWMLGRLTRSSVTSSVPDDVLPTVGYNGTTPFTPPPLPVVPINPAVLSVIIDYLLND